MTVPQDNLNDPVAQRNATRVNLNRVMVAWVFGAVWIALVGGAVLIRFGEEMGLRDPRYRFAWGLLGGMPYLGTFFQVIGSYVIERFQNRKAVFFAGFLVQRLVWLAVGALPWLILPGSAAAIFGVLGLVLAHATSGAIAVPAWTSWMADIIPDRMRGRYFGMRSQLGLAVLIPVSLTAGWLLRASNQGMLHVPYPTGLTSFAWWSRPFWFSTVELCSMIFCIAALFGIADLLFFIRVPDRPRRRLERPPSLREIFGPPLRNRAFRRFLLFYAVLILGAPGIGNYVWLYILNDLAVPDVWAQAMFMAGPGLGAMMFGGLWGRLIDRVGRKTVWMIATAFPAILPACWILVTPSWWWIGFIIPFLGGVFWNGIEQANFNSMLRFASGEKGSSSYQAIFALAVSAAGFLSGLLFGLVAQLTRHVSWNLGSWHIHHYFLLFAIATAIRSVAYIFLLPRVADEGREPVRVAMRYAFTNIYNTIFTRLAFPLRVFGVNLTSGSYDPHEQDDTTN